MKSPPRELPLIEELGERPSMLALLAYFIGVEWWQDSFLIDRNRHGFSFWRYQSGVMGKSLSDFYKFSSCCTMSKLDDSSGALSAAAVAKETLKDRVTDGKVDHLGGQV
ncbi:hypothetical protein ACOSQ2_028517 [Xanthoceras sorbifolium]